MLTFTSFLQLMNMTFGDWELFKVMILLLREQQMLSTDTVGESKNVKFHQNLQHQTSNVSLERKGKECERDFIKIEREFQVVYLNALFFFSRLVCRFGFEDSKCAVFESRPS